MEEPAEPMKTVRRYLFLYRLMRTFGNARMKSLKLAFACMTRGRVSGFYHG